MKQKSHYPFFNCSLKDVDARDYSVELRNLSITLSGNRFLCDEQHCYSICYEKSPVLHTAYANNTLKRRCWKDSISWAVLRFLSLYCIFLWDSFTLGIFCFLLLSFLYIRKEFSILHLNIELPNFFFWFPKHLFSWLSRWIECTILRHHSSAIVNKSRESLDYWWFQVLGHSISFKLTTVVGKGCFLKMRREHFVKNYKWEKIKNFFLENYRATEPWALPSLTYVSHISILSLMEFYHQWLLRQLSLRLLLSAPKEVFNLIPGGSIQVFYLLLLLKR